jgi:hypothetical protein
MAMPALRRMLVVLGNMTVVVMVTLSGERCRRQRKSGGKNYQQTKIAKHEVLPPRLASEGCISVGFDEGQQKGAGSL